jgi:hypothetical protein
MWHFGAKWRNTDDPACHPFQLVRLVPPDMSQIAHVKADIRWF